MRHIDLFSGIGGNALAVDTVWPDSKHVFCDSDKFCQKVLKKHWPKSKIYEDIRTFANTRSKELRRLSNSKWKEVPETWSSVEILTGDFPCQPFSSAGKRKGTEDNRYLWPEMFRIIQTFKPTWVIAENVRGLVTWNEGMVLEQVCTDLESEGYEVQPFIIPAVAVNAPHRRDRIWFVANRSSNRRDGQEPATEAQKGYVTGFEEAGKLARGFERPHSDDTNTQCSGLQRSGEKRQRQYGQLNRNRSYKGSDWNENWLEVATELCGVDDGLPVWMDRFELSKVKHRKERLKSLGNSIVPQVAIEIMKAIKYAQPELF